MESGRTYTSSSTRKLSFRVQMGSTNLNSQIGSGLSDDELIGEHALNRQNKENVVNKSKQLQDAAKENETEEATNEAAHAQGKLNQFTPIRNIPRVSRMEEYSAIEDIRQQCIFYLWTIFFGKSRANGSPT